MVCSRLLSHTVTALAADERRVRARFQGLVENRKYSMSLIVRFAGGLMQQSEAVQISMAW